MPRLLIRGAMNDMLGSYFYLDTPQNARKNGMSATSRHEDAILKRFVEYNPPQKKPTKDIMSFERITKSIEDNGGQIAELDDPKLTHVVLDKRDDSRRRELMKRTSKYGSICITFPFAILTRIYRPKHRNLVLSDFIEACIEENTLLNEVGELNFRCFCYHLAQFPHSRLHALSQTIVGRITWAICLYITFRTRL
jgi:DNA ligase 4